MKSHQSGCRCACRKSNPDILLPAENWTTKKLSGPLDGTRNQRMPIAGREGHRVRKVEVGASGARVELDRFGFLRPPLPRAVLASVAHGHDPAGQKATERGMPSLAELADRFMAEHVVPKRKVATAEFYRDILDRLVPPRVAVGERAGCPFWNVRASQDGRLVILHGHPMTEHQPLHSLFA